MKLTDKLDLLMEERGINKRDLSRNSGIPYTTIVNFYEKGTKNVKLSTLRKLTDYFNVSLDYLADDECEERIGINKCKTIPLVGTIAAGEPILAQENIIDYICDLTGKCDFALKIKGNSMINARIFDGDTVLIRKQNDVESGEIAAVLFNGEEATLKRVYKKKDCIILHPENPTMADRRIEKGDYDDLRIIGKAMQVIFDI